MGKFIVIEGIDGSGKSTQIEFLRDYLKIHNINYKYIHFPRLNAPVYGEMIAKFLRGEYGESDHVNPYFVALLYAGDRENAKQLIQRWLKRDYLVLVDRYVCSNIAFQCAKYDRLEDKINISRWIGDLEYNYNKIPKPNLSLFLHVPFEFVKNKLSSERQGKDREYLMDKIDIHENSLDLQKNVESEYLNLVVNNKDFYQINCFCQKNGQILSPENIHKKIIKVLKRKLVL